MPCESKHTVSCYHEAFHVMVCALVSPEACLFWMILNSTASRIGSNIYGPIQELRPDPKPMEVNVLTSPSMPHRNHSMFGKKCCS